MKVRTSKKILSLILIVCMAVTMMPTLAHAEEGEYISDILMGISGEIIAFDKLAPSIARQRVPLGTNEGDLDLPETLTVTMIPSSPKEDLGEDDGDDALKKEEPLGDEITEDGEDGALEMEGPSEDEITENDEDDVLGKQVPLENELPEDNGDGTLEMTAPLGDEITEDDEDGALRMEVPLGDELAENDEEEALERTVSIPVTWTSSPKYDGDIADTYLFTPSLPKEITLAKGVEVPKITVIVGRVTGVVTAFEELDEDIRWQNTMESVFPETVSATVNGETTWLPVTWETEEEFDKHYPRQGLYVFIATLSEDYVLDEGVEAPRITLYIPQDAGMMLLRSSGTGASTSPLQITTAHQLREIAVLVNDNRLEKFLFNNESAKAYLKLMNDIDLSAYGPEFTSFGRYYCKGWVPIGSNYGSSGNPFRGVFDGGGHTITGLYLDNSGLDAAGLFGAISGGEVKNLSVIDAYVIGGNRNGIIAGSVLEGSSVTNCQVSGEVRGYIYIGGVAGTNSGVIENCSADCTIGPREDYDSHYVGGIVGFVYIMGENKGVVRACYATGIVSGKYYIGGIVGGSYNYTPDSSLRGAIVCAALNASVTGTDAVGRVIGQGSSLACIAFANMEGTSSGGSNVTAKQLQSKDKFPALLTTSPWTYEPGKLPGLFGKAVSMPLYLLDKEDAFLEGKGTQSNPFLIRTPQQLYWVSEKVKENDIFSLIEYDEAYYKLTNDIDLSAYGADWDGGKGWLPIGNGTFDGFKGTFDGDGHSITGLYINRTGQHVGLFGTIDGGTVRNVAVINMDITGDSFAGGIAGMVSDNSTVESCFVSGIIRNSYCAGGIVGYANGDYSFSMKYGEIKNCYTNVDVTGTRSAGGISGYLKMFNVTSCYALGSVSAGLYSGGVVGSVDLGAAVKDCIALNLSVSGQSNDVGRVVGLTEVTQLSGNYAFDGMMIIKNGSNVNITGGTTTNIQGASKTAEELKQASGFPEALRNSPWRYTPGALPVLTYGAGELIHGQDGAMPSYIGGENYFSGGDGSPESPYLILTAHQLAKLAELVNSNQGNYRSCHYKLLDDIDISAYTNSGGWTPIGKTGAPFSGSFNGDGRIIRGLWIDRVDTGVENQGLFGYIKEATIENLGMTEVDIRGNTKVGGLVGLAEASTIQYCYVSGNVYTFNKGGGLAGRIVSTRIISCYTSGSSQGYSNIGGIVGEVDGNSLTYSLIQYCYTTATLITVVNQINGGGIAGNAQYMKIQGCYVTYKVAGANNVGGIVGKMNTYSTVTECVMLGSEVSGQSNVRRIVGTMASGNTSLENNYAFSGMSGGGNDKKPDGLDGANVGIDQIDSASFWKDTLLLPDTVWTMVNGKLPILKNVGGNQSGDSGLYVMKRDLSKATLAPGPSYYGYTGKLIEPEVTLTYGEKTLIKDLDYRFVVDVGSPSNGINPGTVKMKIEGIDNFTGSLNTTFTIVKGKPSVDDLDINFSSKTYNGMPQTPGSVGPKAGITGLGEITLKYNGSTTLPTEVGIYTVTADIAEGENYEAATNISLPDYEILKANPPSIIWPTASSITYGQELSESILSESFEMGTFGWTNGTVFPKAGSSSYEVTFTPTDTKNYDWTGVTLTHNITVIVNKASGLSVLELPSENIVVSDSLPNSFTYDMDNIVLNKSDTGNRSYSAVEEIDSSNILSNVEVNENKLTYDIANHAKTGDIATITLTITTDNYQDVTATLTIITTAKKAQSIAFDISAKEKTYGDDSFIETAVLEGEGGTGDIAYTSSNPEVATVNSTTGEVTIVGAGVTHITATKAEDEDYNQAAATYILTVNKKVVTVKAEDKAVKVGDDLPSLNVSYFGFIGTDSEENALTTMAVAKHDAIDTQTAGNFLISFSTYAVLNEINGNNYTLIHENGWLTVSEKEKQTIAFDALEKNKTYGDVSFIETATLQGEGGIGAITYSSSNPEVATVNSKTGEVTIISAGQAEIIAVKAEDEDYAKATATYRLTVNKKDVMVRADDKTVKVGEPLPEFTYTVMGLAYSDTFTDIVLSTTVSNTNKVGEFPITVSGGNLTNRDSYNVTYIPGKLTVTTKNKQVIAFAVTELTKTLGDPNFIEKATLQKIGGTGSISYSSSNTDVAIVNSEIGEVTIIGAGMAMITAIKEEDANYAQAAASYLLTVRPADSVTRVTGITLNPKKITLYTNTPPSTAILTATIEPPNATNKRILWHSNNLAVATVDATGRVSAVADGTAIITARTVDGEYTDTCIVKVITYRSSSGGNNGGSSGGSTGSTPSSSQGLTTTDKQLNTPIVAKINVYGTVKDGVLFGIITEEMVKEGIKAAREYGKSVEGIALEFNIIGSGGYNSLAVSIEEKATYRMKEADMKFVKIGSALLDITLDSEAILEVDKQATGIVTVSAMKNRNLFGVAKKIIGDRPVYDITISYQKNGKTEYISSFGKGKVTLGLIYKAKDIEKSENLFGVYVDHQGKVQPLDDSSYTNERVIFSRNSLSTYGVGYKLPVPDFTDTKLHWAKEDIDFVISYDLINCMGELTFSPDTAITRKDFLAALGRLSGEDISSYKTSSFTDVKDTDPAMGYIEWAVKNKVVSGYGNGKFGPEDPITREQMAMMLANYAKALGYQLPLAEEASPFADDIKISPYAREAVNDIHKSGIIRGKANNCFDPQSTATRAEAAVILHRFVEIIM